jgi:hypothetical protein
METMEFIEPKWARDMETMEFMEPKFGEAYTSSPAT